MKKVSENDFFEPFYTFRRKKGVVIYVSVPIPTYVKVKVKAKFSMLFLDNCDSCGLITL